MHGAAVPARGQIISTINNEVGHMAALCRFTAPVSGNGEMFNEDKVIDIVAYSIYCDYYYPSSMRLDLPQLRLLLEKEV
ncbi:hypothetical protein XELAEV_18032312mg [Xenopus laevis]|uniref:Uncharacterized protein n=1 Tax=Xenopus laevis TaxID=8355 RepID=A0A974HGX4_XENLA|nr:hypothetical protein XELAEV_18032312mg [Xenopus laevis]